jgi:hypothetical protein
MSAEACYFSMYSSEVSMPAGPVVSNPVNAAEAAHFALYANCSPPSLEVKTEPTATQPASQSQHTPSRMPDLRSRVAKVVPEVTEDVTVEAPWPSEAFDEVPTGTMTLGGFLDALKRNMDAATTWKPAGYLKALAEKVFTFSAEPAKTTES